MQKFTKICAFYCMYACYSSTRNFLKTILLSQRSLFIFFPQMQGGDSHESQNIAAFREEGRELKVGRGRRRLLSADDILCLDLEVVEWMVTYSDSLNSHIYVFYTWM